MDSLESRLERMSPEQRREVEDFVDFLLSRSGTPPGNREASNVIPPALNVVPPALRIEEIPVSSPPAAGDAAQCGHGTETAPVLQPDAGRQEGDTIHEIEAGGSDWVTRDYLDYGQFEEKNRSQPSPATEAVQRVKVKLGGKKEPEPGKHILEWID